MDLTLHKANFRVRQVLSLVIGLLALGLLFGTAASSTAEGEGPAVVTDNMQARLVSEYRSIVPGQVFTVAMHQQIRPHWHTYWRNPGDSGEPTELKWRLPEGWKASDIEWPAPQRIPLGPLLNFGYSDEVLLLVSLQAPASLRPGARIRVEADAYWLVCEETCIPEEGILRLDLEAGETPQRGTWYSRLQAARAALPRELPWPARFSLAGTDLVIEIPVPAEARISDATYFPYQKDVIQNAAEQRIDRAPGTLSLTVPTSFAAATDRLAGVIVLSETAGATTLQRAYRVAPAAKADTPYDASLISWWQAILMALAGGILLNLMPCVFPVLSIKALSLVELANHGTQKHRGARHALTYTAGVLIGFVTLALLLIAFRSTGEAIGWGFQLQNPVVVLALAWLFFVIGLNLSGFFSITGRFSGLGQKLTEGDGGRQSFFTGLLATLVATPCTAPFMGVAMGFALLQPAYLTLLIFGALGLGMALPMALLSRFPGWLRFLPAPGAWMDKLKEFLAFPMYLSCVWMLWVFQSQVGERGILIGGGGLVLLALLLWSAKLAKPAIRHAGIALSALLIIGLLAMSSPDSGDSSRSTAAEGWQVYSTGELAEARREGPVFVNFTADWCITCKVNEQVAMTDRVIALFDEKQVTRFIADWTSRNPIIARDIELYGRSGVPLYLWYGEAGIPEPEILPQLLSEQMLISRLEALP